MALVDRAEETGTDAKQFPNSLTNINLLDEYLIDYDQANRPPVDYSVRELEKVESRT